MTRSQQLSRAGASPWAYPCISVQLLCVSVLHRAGASPWARFPKAGDACAGGRGRVLAGGPANHGWRGRDGLKGRRGWAMGARRASLADGAGRLRSGHFVVNVWLRRRFLFCRPPGLYDIEISG